MNGYLLWAVAPFFVTVANAALYLHLRGQFPRGPFGCKEMTHTVILFGVGVLAVLGAFVGGMGFVNYFEAVSCEHQAKRMGLEWDYSLWTPCLVELPDGRWVDIDKIDNDHLTGEISVKGVDR